MPSNIESTHQVPFREAVRVWLRIALLSFGGPAGQIAVMHRILVEEKKWMKGFINFHLGIDGVSIPDVYALHQNYPNPFNPTTQIKYDLPEDAMVSITIYDLMGRQVKTLVNSSQTAGYRSIQWNATNNEGQPVSAGLYLYTIQAGKFRQTKKMVLLK